jgi:hypothetical protein
MGPENVPSGTPPDLTAPEVADILRLAYILK